MAPQAIEPEVLPTNSMRARGRRSLRSDSHGNMGFAAAFIIFVIAIIIAIKFLPTLTASVATAQGDGNLSASDSSLLDLVPTITVVILVVAAIAVLFWQLRKAGMMGGGGQG